MISDSSPIIFLAKIGKLELLNKLFKKITIPESVKEELLIEEKEGFSVINKAINDSWIAIENPKKEMDLNLGKGENAAINLALEKKEQLIVDDALAIKIAKSFNIETLRTTSVLFLALKKNIITKKETANSIGRIIQEGYYLSPKYYSMLMQALEEYN